MKIPSTGSCGSKMDIQHAMRFKKGGLITIRHNDLRNLTAYRLTESCKDVDIEPKPVMGEIFNNRTASTSNEARVNIQSRGFLVRGQQIFFDSRTFYPNASWYLNKALPQCYIQNENRKKREYHQLFTTNWIRTKISFTLLSRRYYVYVDQGALVGMCVS